MQYHRNEIRDAFLKAGKLIDSGKCSGADVLRVMQPYHDCTHIMGSAEGVQQEAIALIFALTADGYRVSQEPERAAAWYRKASEHHFLHAPFYARVVCQHRLTEHYDIAFAALQKRRKHWHEKGLVHRLHALWYTWNTLFDPRFWKLWYHRNSDFVFLAEQTKAA